MKSKSDWGEYIDNALKEKNGAASTPPPAVNGHRPEPDHPLVKRALEARLTDLAAMEPNSGRNDALNIAAGYLGRFPIDRQQLRDLLLDACRANGVIEDGHKACDDTISSGFDKADRDGPRTIEDRNRHTITFDPNEPLDDTNPATQDELETLEEDFWTSRPSLQLIYIAALSRMASPWAVAGCCAGRALARIPPAIRLPPIIGGPGSLNLLIAISSKSGGGKGAAMTTAAQLIPDDNIHIRGIGSGEGMIETYNRSKNNDEDNPPIISVLFSVDEIDSLAAMGGRSGQTTMAIIRQGFSGEQLGYSYRGRQSEIVAAHTYRMILIASVQPERAGVLFDDVGGGTPQRFMWFPARDKRITDNIPTWPEDKTGPKQIPMISTTDMSRNLGCIPVPEITVQTIRQARVASMRGCDNTMDSHALFCREKFAFALAVMDLRLEINEEDWRLSGIAAAVSDWWRTRAQTGYQKGKERMSRERGEMRAHEDDERSLTLHNTQLRHIARIMDSIGKMLADGPMTRGAINRKLTSRDRPRLDTALKTAADYGLITQEDDRWKLVPR